MPSFDIVSQVDMQEVRNAVDQAMREVVNRYDFKGTDTKITLTESPAGRSSRRAAVAPGPSSPSTRASPRTTPRSCPRPSGT